MDGLPGILLAAVVGIGALGPRRRAASPARHIVLADSACPLDDCAAQVEASGAQVLRVLPLIHGVVCSCPGPVSVSAISGHGGVVTVEEDWRVPLPREAAPVGRTLPDLSRLFSRDPVPWGVTRIGAPAVWSRTRGDGVKVAVIDTGVDIDHPDLLPNLRGGINLLESASPPVDDSGHGTHVSGIVAAADSQDGVVGVAPNAELYVVKAFDATGSAATSDVLTALQWCADYGMQVVNMSFGQEEHSPSVARAVAACERLGMVLVASAGNGGPGVPVDFPARLPEVLAVTGASRSNQVMSRASRGPEIDLAAPGSQILSLRRGGGFRTMSGTSMAAPHAAGAAALLLSAFPGLSPAEVRQALIQTAERLEAERLEAEPGEQGAGMLRVDQAFAQLARRWGAPAPAPAPK